MTTGRLEAFSDGVLAVIITIMVLELKVPRSGGIDALTPVLPVLLGYVLSFVYVGIYWNNHHHMFQAVGKVNGAVLWANLHLLFWLSLIPFVTGWMGENHRQSVPTAVYGIVLLMAAVAFTVLQRATIKLEGHDSKLAAALGKDSKGQVSMLLYAAALPLAFVDPLISDGIFILVAILWFVPDRRIEKKLEDDPPPAAT